MVLCKILPLFFLFFLPNISGKVYANEIDRLNTIKDVENFLVEKVDTRWQEKGNTTIVNNVTKYFKTDIDNNGLTDLLVNVNFCFVVLDHGDGRYEMRDISAGVMERTYSLIDVLHLQGLPLLVVNMQIKCGYDSDSRNDTLLFQDGNFIEYTTSPDTKQVERIHFKSDGGFGGIGFELYIDSSRWSTFEKHDNGLRIFAGTIDSLSFDKIERTINYIKLASLKNYYPYAGGACVMTDQASYEIEVTFGNGEIKKINDYGGNGTFGLAKLYEQLLVLETNLTELK